MKSLRSSIQEAARVKAVPQYVIEKDYAQSYLLAGISNYSPLKDELIFKGGTALKKCYFGDYRFSEDLDFSCLNIEKHGSYEKNLQNVCDISLSLLKKQGPFEIDFKRQPERDVHPFGQEAFVALVQFPWHPNPQCRIKIEITQDEAVLMTPNICTIKHNYPEIVDQNIKCYTLEEIIAEKMRAILQTQYKLETRGWTRYRPRDYYDIWRIHTEYKNQLTTSLIPAILKKKCKLRNVSYKTPDDFFDHALVQGTKNHWDKSLGTFIKPLPTSEKVINGARLAVESFLGPTIGTSA